MELVHITLAGYEVVKNPSPWAEHISIDGEGKYKKVGYVNQLHAYFGVNNTDGYVNIRYIPSSEDVVYTNVSKLFLVDLRFVSTKELPETVNLHGINFKLESVKDGYLGDYCR